MVFRSCSTLLAAVLLGVAGCGSGSDPGPGTDITVVTPETEAETPESEEAGEVTDTEPAEDTEPADVTEGTRTGVPDDLVGTWDGDRAQLSFTADGYVRYLLKSGGSDSGTVAVDGNSMTLYLSGGPIAVSHWELSHFDAGYGYEFDNLSLDGVSYVRDAV